MQNGFGASLLIGLPFLAIYLLVGLPQIGVFTWYSSGDDWWMFQRYGYRIFMEGYWLEGGQLTFWFQPFYRWISGALHMVFGDSSVGELWWDASCAGIGAFFTYLVTRRFAGFRWGLLRRCADAGDPGAGPGVVPVRPGSVGTVVDGADLRRRAVGDSCAPRARGRDAGHRAARRLPRSTRA